MMIDLTGQQFGNYRLTKLLGSGGFASVYLGQHRRIATQQAAIKVLHLTQVDTEKFHKEAETTASLRHPHIVRLLDFDIQQGTPFLVMDYAPNGSLRARHAANEQLPLAVVMLYVKQIVEALQYAHDHNIIHRDIKPDNVLIGPHGELLLGDFGIAVISKTGLVTLQPSYGTAGTPYYMAPEMFRAKPEKASDQYALAVMVYQWLSGTLPFSEGDFIQLGYQHAVEPVPPLRDKVPSIWAAVEEVVMKALVKQPQDRFPSVRAFAEALEEASKKPPIGTVLLTYRGPGYTCAWSPDGTRLASASDDKTVQIWDARSGSPLLSYFGHSSNVRAVAWSPDGTCLASASDDHTVQVWDARSGSQILSYSGHSRRVNAVAWSPDGTRLASASFDETVQVWDARSGSQILSYSGHSSPVRAVMWSPDGTRLASTSYGTMEVWDARSGSQILSYSGPFSWVNTVAWSPDGPRLASAYEDGTVQVWDIRSGSWLLSYSGHSGWWVNAVAWSPDGTRLASASDDHTVQVWDARSGSQILSYSGHSFSVNAVAWSPDGTRLASGALNGVVVVWQAV